MMTMLMRTPALLASLTLACAVPVSAQPDPIIQNAADWSSSVDDKGITTFIHASRDAYLIVGPASSDEGVPFDARTVITQLSGAFVATGQCQRGTGVQPAVVMRGAAGQLYLDSVSARCTFFVGQRTDGAGFAIAAVEQPGASANARAFAQALLDTIVGHEGATAVASPSAAPSPDQSGAAQPTPAALQAAVTSARRQSAQPQAVFLRTMTSGPGQITTFIYALYPDGSYVDIDAFAPEDVASIDLARREHGRWSRRGGNYILTASDGDVREFEASGAEAPFAASKRLVGTYRSVSGSILGFGSTGGSIFTDFITFTADGRFATTSDAAISITTAAPGVAIAGARSYGTSRGRYLIQGHTLHLLYDNGDIRRQSIVEVEGGGVGNASTYFIGGSLFFTD